MSADYGISVNLLPDLDDTGAELTDIRVLQQDILIALSTSSAPVVVVDGVLSSILWWADPTASLDLAEYLLEGFDQADQRRLEARILAIYQDDARFTSFSAAVSFDGAARRLTVAIDATASGKALTMTVVADSNGVQIA